MPYQRTTEDEFQIHVNYGQGWEYEIAEATRKAGLAQLRLYRENCPEYPVRLVCKRVPIKMAIYKKGSRHLQTTVTNGHADFSDGLTVEEYLEKNPGLTCIPLDDALDLIRKAEEKTYIRGWVKISENQYMEKMNCLPPEKWLTVDGVTIFRMCEYLTSNITAHLAEYNGKHYRANRRTSVDYTTLAEEVRNIK